MKGQFHITPKGQVRKCSAEKNCPYGGQSGIINHYSTEAEARKEYENRNIQSTFVKNFFKSDAEQGFNDAEDLFFKVVELEAKTARSLSAKNFINAEMSNRTLLEERFNSWAPDPTEKYPNMGYITPLAEKLVSAMDHAEKSYIPNYYPHYSGGIEGIPDLLKKWDELKKSCDLNYQKNSELLDEAKADLEHKRKIMVAKTGYEENPKYGIPTGETTMSKKFSRGNYCSLPSKDVPILNGGKQHCRKCGGELEYVKEGPFGNWFHVNQSDKDSCGEKSYSNPGSCIYCGTTNGKFLQFAQKSWSNETTCLRCGGVNGYGIGD